ncbi:hypothetical protein [Holdemania massiliensis]|uniref:hypothetical protein n=1 Tax=Holdemania massiliensis TaxID=1468449 RepID=UPI001F0592FC|nr:hypothetical protein [Holdemania massiliensis]MCH1939238.1 hypothetical protein [Holdemania massiliensis]
MQKNRDIKLENGYVIGNGQVLITAGLGVEIQRHGKPVLTDHPCSKTAVAAVSGPDYVCNNLAFGFTIEAEEPWKEERAGMPDAQCEFYHVLCQNSEASVQVEDSVFISESVWIRTLRSTAALSVRVRIETDPRNGEFLWWDGTPVKPESELYAPSVDPDQWVQVQADQLIFQGAPRRLFQDISNAYRYVGKPRYLAVQCNAQSCVDPTGFRLQLEPDQPVSLISCLSLNREEASAFAKQLAKLSSDELQRRCLRMQQDRFLKPKAAPSDPLAKILQGTEDLIQAVTADNGASLAQSFIYPLHYIRDQYGIFRFHQQCLNHREMKRICQAYLGFERQFGIQNAYDPITPHTAFAARSFKPISTEWEKTELPSYINLFVLEYVQLTQDLTFAAEAYPILRYNVLCQSLSEVSLLSGSGDETYVHISGLGKEADFTDSCFLYLKNCQGMKALAEKLNQNSDAALFEQRLNQVSEALMKYNYGQEGQYFQISRSQPDWISDVLLMPYWINMDESWKRLCRAGVERVKNEAVRPYRSRNQDDRCTGMMPAMLLSALCQLEDPAWLKVCDDLGKIASPFGLFCEYYRTQEGTMIGYSGGQRPWESACAASALIEMLIGMKVDPSSCTLTLNIHIPPSWQGFATRWIELFDGSEIKLEVTLHHLTLMRRNAENPLHLNGRWHAFQELKILQGDVMDQWECSISEFVK